MHLNHYQDVQLLELRMTFCNILLEYLMADFLCLSALNKVLVLCLIYFVYLQLIWSPYTTFNTVIKFISCNISVFSLYNEIVAGNVIAMM